MRRFSSILGHKTSSPGRTSSAPPDEMMFDDPARLITPFNDITLGNGSQQPMRRATHDGARTYRAASSPQSTEPRRATLGPTSSPQSEHRSPLPPPYASVPGLDAARSARVAPRSSLPLPSLQQDDVASDSPANQENLLRILSKYDIVYLVDDSGSMGPLWQQAKEALVGVVSKSIAFDKDGIDIFFLNSERQLEGCTSASTVRALFDEVRPRGSTPTAYRLDDLVRPYIERVEDAKHARRQLPKPLVLLCITDGRADDPDTLLDVVVEMAGRLDDIRAPPFQLGIQFLQIGQDPDATAFLRELDDDLKARHGVRDIVDTVEYRGTLSSDFIIQACLGAINRRIDAQSH